MALKAASLPQVSLERPQWVRFVVVAIFVILAAARVAPDLIRVVYPLGEFDYVTNGDGVVIEARATRGGLVVGDVIRMDRIKPFDRKSGILGVGYTYDNPDRELVVERHGKRLHVSLKARPENVAGRALAALRVAIFLTIVVLGAILFLVKPTIATAAILAYCLGSDGPSTWLALQIPNPWRQAYEWIGNVSLGTAIPALLLFALCLVYEDPRVQRLATYVTGALAAFLGTFGAYAAWLMTYPAKPAETMATAVVRFGEALTLVTVVTFVAAFVRAHGGERRRIGWTVAAFALASVARLASDTFYPEHIRPWENGILLSATVLPILVVWFAVIRERFFNVDFVVARAVVYVALTATVVGIISASEEIGTYVFYQNTDLAYGFLIAISMVIGSTTGKMREGIEHLVDRFIFRDRSARQHALELIAGYVLDAETRADVERALLEDVTHALHLSFGGIFTRDADGAFRLSAPFCWPQGCGTELASDTTLLRAIHRTRGTMRFSGKESTLIRGTFPGQPLTFAAPIFVDRNVEAVVVYGRSAIGLDLDPHEREALIEVVTHASIALNAIELARYRALAPQVR
jgi:hypothetical protein